MPESTFAIYLTALESHLSKISLTEKGVGRHEVDSRELYYILQTDEGKYAFRSHARQMERANDINDLLEPDGRERKREVSPDRSEGSTLECENEYPPQSLVLGKDANAPSRILAIANAGHGKTTLLSRLALYYCRTGRHDALDGAVRDAYVLPDDIPLIPIIIKLRSYSEALSQSCVGDVSESDFIDSAIRDSISRELELYGREHSAQADLNIASLSGDRERAELLLLIDGLDELSKSGRKAILRALRLYLEEYPDTRIILTSRVAGLSEDGVMSELEALRFRGRSIMPLTDRCAREYAELRISKTCEPSRAQDMIRLLDRMMTHPGYRYMREMMHAPLDLAVMLMSLSGGALAPNRFRMFTDIMRKRFTSHEKDSTLCEPIFADTMLILGLCAYRMQKRSLLYISEGELEEYSRILSKYSYQSDIIGNCSLEDCIAFFDRLSENSGIVEKESITAQNGEVEIRYTVPIRSYHECLVAYAVCNLRFSSDMPRPNPSGILIKHCEDKGWSGIISFAIAHLSALDGESEELKALLEHIFSCSRDTEQLRGIIESDPELYDGTARLLFEKGFDKRHLDSLGRELISACMLQSYYYSYEFALFSLYRGASGDKYLEAYAYAAALSRVAHSVPLIDEAVKKLGGANEKNAIASAAIICEAAELAMSRPPSSKGSSEATGELPELRELCCAAGESLVPDRALAELLYKRATTDKKLVYLEALSRLFVLSHEWADIVGEFIDETLLGSAVEILEEALPTVAEGFRCGLCEDDLTDFTELVYALGVIGTVFGYSDLLRVLPDKARVSAIKTVIDAVIQALDGNRHIDRLSAAYARLLFGGGYEELVDILTNGIYHSLIEEGKSELGIERTVRLVKNPDCCPRERRLCELLKDTLIPIAEDFVLSRVGFYNINPEIEAELLIERYFFESTLERLGLTPQESAEAPDTLGL